MRLLLDENIPRATETFLRAAGHAVQCVARGAADRDIAAIAQSTDSILLTRDRDFLMIPPMSLSGTVVIRIHPPLAEEITQAVGRLLAVVPESEFHGKVLVLRHEGYEVFHE